MSDQDELYIDQDFSWDAPLITDAGGGRTHFATLRMFSPSVIPFQSGQSFALPGVYHDVFDEASKLTRREGQKQFNGMILGTTSKNHHYYILVATKTDKAGGEYQVIKGFKSWPEKNRKNIWAELQYPALQKLPAATRQTLGRGGVIYVQFEDVPTGETYTPANGDKTYDIHYWGEFKVYPDLASLKAAEKEHFAQFGTNGTGESAGLDLSNFPGGDWASDDPATIKGNWGTLQESIVAGGTDSSNFVRVAKDLYLVKMIGEKVIVVNRINSEEPVNLPELWATMLDIPVDDGMVAAFSEEAIKAALKAKK